MQRLVDQLMDRMSGEWSRSTRHNYLFALVEFSGWVEAEGLDFRQIEGDQIMVWLGSRTTWGASMRHNALCALKAFYSFAVGEANSPAAGLRVKRPRPKPLRTLTPDEVAHVLQSIDTGPDLGVRDLSIITLMLDTGLRSSELCRLAVENVDLERRELSVVIKGGDWSRRIFGAYAGECLRSWLAVRSRHAMPDANQVYVSIGGTIPGRGLSRGGLRVIMASIARRAGVKRFSPHALRRTFATIAIQSGAPTRLVQIAGGWKDLEMVERYTQYLNPKDFHWFPTDHVMGISHAREE